jgi:hypothetical protein
MDSGARRAGKSRWAALGVENKERKWAGLQGFGPAPVWAKEISFENFQVLYYLQIYLNSKQV